MEETKWLKQGAMPVQGLGGTAIASLILFVVDQNWNAGRYSEVAAALLRQACGLVGIHF
jgi:hypothetical protein